jgi:hypothetical protein
MMFRMRPRATIPNAVVTAFFLGLIVTQDAFGANNAPDSPAEVTTDTAAYCALLAAKMDQESDASFDAIALGAQGKQLCADGEFSAGVARLRRALLAARDDGYDPELTIPATGGAATAPSAPSVGFPSIIGSDGPENGTVVFPPPPTNIPDRPAADGPPHGDGRGR